MNNQIISQGAEAIIEEKENFIIKKRIEKSYRIKELDEKIRKLRTRSEGRIMERASKVISVPKIFKIDESKKEIEMQKINGKKLSDYINKCSIVEQEKICIKIGENISKLHNHNLIHGDLTTSNMILIKNRNNFEVYFIDFGLGFISSKVEDKAVDLHLLKEALEAGFSRRWEILFNFVKIGYKRYNRSKFVLERLKAVEKRGRYKQGY